jgi:hypothetical protein
MCLKRATMQHLWRNLSGFLIDNILVLIAGLALGVGKVYEGPPAKGTLCY